MKFCLLTVEGSAPLLSLLFFFFFTLKKKPPVNQTCSFLPTRASHSSNTIVVLFTPNEPLLGSSSFAQPHALFLTPSRETQNIRNMRFCENNSNSSHVTINIVLAIIFTIPKQFWFKFWDEIKRHCSQKVLKPLDVRLQKLRGQIKFTVKGYSAI